MSEFIEQGDSELELYSGHSKLNIMHSLALMSGYEERVPTVEEFIDDPFYLGKMLGDGLYPIWRKAAIELFPTPYNCEYNTIVLTGGIGLGKSTMSILIVLYDLCKMLSLKNPHQYYNLIESTVISFALMNATKGLASGVLMGQIIEWIEASPYFKSKLAPKHSRTLFIKNIDITIGSRARDMLGQATVSAIFSEINDMTAVGNQAEDNLDTVSTRRISRFEGKGKPINGRLILDSSNKGNRSFIDARIEEATKHGVKDFKVFSFSHWEAKMHLGGYSGKYFQVYGGDENRDPFIITDDNKVLSPSLNPSRLVDVPVEHTAEFEFNIIKSLRDLAGISTYSTFSFLSSNAIISQVFDRVSVISKPIIVLDFFDQSQNLDQFIDIKLLAFLCNKPRFISVDLGLKYDSTGIACSYLDGYTDTKNYDPLTGRMVINREPIFITEWVMEVRAVPGQEVAIYKIKEFLLLAKRLGYPIQQVSTDGFQSSGLRQDLSLKGINTALISVDRTKDPYYFLRNCMLEGRLHAPNIEKLIKEVRELEETDGKFDHPASNGGSKDLVDAVCSSVWSCYQNLAKAGTAVSAESVTNALDTALSLSSRTSESQFENLLISKL